ncbi:MAG: hypothetical protein GX245_00525 [Eubacteriaceae bacterium]|jgi:antitoxin HicB|nr:hypothetical protein [Eubacteriaceae bacterium]
MYKVYPAIINKENDVFWMEFPDLPGCQTMGETIEETMKNAEEALGLFLASFVEDGQEIPEASAIEDIESKYSKSYVSADVSKYIRKTKAVKKTLTIPEWMNEEAEKQHINFSKVLQEALAEKLEL